MLQAIQQTERLQITKTYQKAIIQILKGLIKANALHAFK